MSKDITVEQLFSMMQEMQRTREEKLQEIQRQHAESVERLWREHAELRRERDEKLQEMRREGDERQRERAETSERLLRERAEAREKLERERAEAREKLEREQDEALKKEPCRAGEYNSKNATILPKFDEEKNFIPPKKQLDNKVGEDISNNRTQHILQTCLSVCKSPCWISYALASSFVVAAAILSVVFVDGVAEEVKIGVMCGVSAGTCIASIIVLAARTMREQRGGYGVV